MEYLLQHGADVHAKDDGEYFVILNAPINVNPIRGECGQGVGI